MNRKGMTLVEIIVAAAIMVTAVSSFAYLTKAAGNYVSSTEKLSRALYEARSRMEDLHKIPSAAELEIIRVEQLYSLRSRYL